MRTFKKVLLALQFIAVFMMAHEQPILACMLMFFVGNLFQLEVQKAIRGMS